MGRLPKYIYPFEDVCTAADHGAGVYYIMNTMSNRMRIGQTLGIYQRMQTHYGQLQNGTHTNKALQKDWNAFGEYNFEFGILVTIPRTFHLAYAERYLRDLELHFMRLYQTKNPIYGYDFDQRPTRPAEKVYEGFFAHVSRVADDEIAKTLGEAQP